VGTVVNISRAQNVNSGANYGKLPSNWLLFF